MQLLGNFRDFEIAKGGPFALSAIIRDLKISLIIAEIQKFCKGGIVDGMAQNCKNRCRCAVLCREMHFCVA